MKHLFFSQSNAIRFWHCRSIFFPLFHIYHIQLETQTPFIGFPCKITPHGSRVSSAPFSSSQFTIHPSACRETRCSAPTVNIFNPQQTVEKWHLMKNSINIHTQTRFGVQLIFKIAQLSSCERTIVYSFLNYNASHNVLES